MLHSVACRTKWKRQTAVGLELLAETGNFMAIKRILQTNPYWAFHPSTEAIIANIEAISKQMQHNAATPNTFGGWMGEPLIEPSSIPIDSNVSRGTPDSLRQIIQSFLIPQPNTATPLALPPPHWPGPIMSPQNFC